jgi:predicted MFS family arabinose efflux permease
LIVAAPGVVFLLNALSFLAVIAVIRKWKGKPHRQQAHRPLLAFMAEGARFVGRDRAMRAVMRRTSTFTLFASSMWALLPAVARQLLHASSAGFGSMLGALGVGAVLAGVILARRREAYRDGHLIAAGTLGFAVPPVVLVFSESLSWAAYALLVLGGIAWMTTMSTLNIAAQRALPDWVRARGLSIHILIFNGSMGFGGWVWGQVAERYGLSEALLASGFGLLLLLPFSVRGYTGIK